MQKQSSTDTHQTNKPQSNQSQPEMQKNNLSDPDESNMDEAATEDDRAPVPDELDLEENNLSTDDADPVEWEEEPDNKDRQDMDKSPGEERGKGERVTKKDLKAKKVDADPTRNNSSL